MRRRVPALLVALAAFVMLGMADGALGVAWPSIRMGLGRGLEDLGLVLAALSAGYLTASTSFGRVHATLGTARALAIGGFAFAVGLGLFAVAAAWYVVLVGAVVLGLGGGLVDSGVNAHAALEFEAGSVNLIHGFYGLGATAGPLVIAASLSASGSFRSGYVGMALVQVLVLGSIVARRRGWETSTDPEHPRAGSGGMTWVRALPLLVVFVVYTGVEVAVGQWAFTLLTESRNLAESAAAGWVAAYWGGLTAGRLLWGAIGERVAPRSLLDGSVAIALLGGILLWVDPLGVGVVGLPLAGAGLAAVFPTMVSLTPERTTRAASTRIMGYQLAAANVGAATVPWLIGLTAANVGVGALAPGLVVGLAALVVAHLWVDRRFGRRPA